MVKIITDLLWIMNHDRDIFMIFWYSQACLGHVMTNHGFVCASRLSNYQATISALKCWHISEVILMEALHGTVDLLLTGDVRQGKARWLWAGAGGPCLVTIIPVSPIIWGLILHFFLKRHNVGKIIRHKSWLPPMGMVFTPTFGWWLGDGWWGRWHSFTNIAVLCRGWNTNTLRLGPGKNVPRPLKITDATLAEGKVGKSAENGGFDAAKFIELPSGYVKIANWKIAIYRVSSHPKWWYSIVMWKFTRRYIHQYRSILPYTPKQKP